MAAGPAISGAAKRGYVDMLLTSVHLIPYEPTQPFLASIPAEEYVAFLPSWPIAPDDWVRLRLQSTTGVAITPLLVGNSGQDMKVLTPLGEFHLRRMPPRASCKRRKAKLKTNS